MAAIFLPGNAAIAAANAAQAAQAAKKKGLRDEGDREVERLQGPDGPGVQHGTDPVTPEQKPAPPVKKSDANGVGEYEQAWADGEDDQSNKAAGPELQKAIAKNKEQAMEFQEAFEKS